MYSKLFREHKHLIDKYVNMYGKLDGYADFRQKLLLSIFIYIEKKTVETGKSPEELLFGAVKILAKRIFYDSINNKQTSFERGFCSIDNINEIYLSDDNTDIIKSIPKHIFDDFDDIEKKIAYAIDTYGFGEVIKYTKIAKKLGISAKTIMYRVQKIKKIIEKYQKRRAVFERVCNI